MKKIATTLLLILAIKAAKSQTTNHGIDATIGIRYLRRLQALQELLTR